MVFHLPVRNVLGFAFKERVEARDDDQREHRRGQQTPDHDDSKGTLNLRPGSSGKEEGDKAKSRYRGGHHHGAESEMRAAHDCFDLRSSFIAQLADVRNQNGSVQHRNSPERDKARRGRDGEVFTRDEEAEDTADRGQWQHRNNERRESGTARRAAEVFLHPVFVVVAKGLVEIVDR